MRASSPAWRLAIFFAVAAALMPLATHAQRRPPPAPAAPPQPVQQSVRVKRGGTVEIPLRIYGTRHQQLEFLIRAQPVHGTLSPPKQTGRLRAVVTYTPPPDLGVVRERFSYAVRSTEGVSAAADVLITIVDAPPELIVPDTLQFPRLFIGESASERIEIVNAGGGIAEGEVNVAPPWKIGGDVHYRLASGERRQMEIVFAPTAAGSHETEITYTSRPDRVTTLRGEALFPIGFEPAELELKHPPSSPVRAAAFEVVNHQSADDTVTLQGSERLLFTRQLMVPAGGRAQVVVQTEARDVASLEEEITVEARGVVARLRIRSPQVGPVLRLNGERIDFGGIPPRTSARRFVEIENIGGTSVTALLAITPPFSIEEKAISVASGEKKRIEVAIVGTSSRKHEGFLDIMVTGREVRVPVSAVVHASRSERSSKTPARPAEAHSDTRQVSLQSRAAAQTPHRAMPADMTPSWVRSVTPDGAQIEWWVNPKVPGPFRAETGKLSLENNELKISWQPHAGFKTHVEGNRVIGTFTGLAAGTVHRMRILAVTGATQSAAPLFEVQFMTTPKPPGLFQVTIGRVLLAALAVCLAVIILKRIGSRRV